MPTETMSGLADYLRAQANDLESFDTSIADASLSRQALRQWASEVEAACRSLRAGAAVPPDLERELLGEIEQEFVALPDLPAFIRRMQDEVREARKGLPSPQALALLVQAQDYAEEVFFDRLRKDDREGLAFNLKSAIREYLLTMGTGPCQQCDGNGSYFRTGWGETDCPNCEGKGYFVNDTATEKPGAAA